MKKKFFLMALLISFTFTSEAFTCNCNTKFCKLFKTFVFKFNNDVIKRRKDPSSDKRYTNGLTLGYITKDLKENTEITNHFPVIDKLGETIHGSICLNHDIYTPDEIEDINILENQHPYSGELNLTFGIHGDNNFKLLSHNTPTLLSLSLSLGTTGKYSYAKNVQTEFHRYTGNDIPLGWDHQLPSHFMGKLSGSVISKFDPIKFKQTLLEVLVNIGADVGNTLRQGSAGIEFRLGWNLPDDFGTYSLDSGSFASNIQSKNSPTRNKTRCGLHLILYTRGKYVDYNYHLGEYLSPTREIAELGGGFGFSGYGYKMTLMFINQSEQFEEQNGPHRFGTVMITYVR